jgi:hypothetical protein
MGETHAFNPKDVPPPGQERSRIGDNGDKGIKTDNNQSGVDSKLWADAYSEKMPMPTEFDLAASRSGKTGVPVPNGAEGAAPANGSDGTVGNGPPANGSDGTTGNRPPQNGSDGTTGTTPPVNGSDSASSTLTKKEGDPSEPALPHGDITKSPMSSEDTNNNQSGTTVGRPSDGQSGTSRPNGAGNVGDHIDITDPFPKKGGDLTASQPHAPTTDQPAAGSHPPTTD